MVSRRRSSSGAAIRAATNGKMMGSGRGRGLPLRLNREAVGSLFRFRNNTQLVNSSQGLSWHDVKKGRERPVRCEREARGSEPQDQRKTSAIGSSKSPVVDRESGAKTSGTHISESSQGEGATA